MRVLVVEDDRRVARFIEKGLREASYAVELADNGDAGLRMAMGGGHDVIVLDLMLPGRDGFSVLRSLRENGVATPVICLTARDGVDDRIRGLDLGADDYLAKPFSFAELMARVRALLRRGSALVSNTVVVGDLTIDLVGRRVERGGRRIELSAREFSLLECLGRSAGQVLSRTILLERVWDMNQDPMTNVVDVHINRLRKKVDQGFSKPLIETIRGVGYVLREETD
ncbi:MAG TPA: heavy metal response regulator transcription factor [Phycisphaerae bacterium]|nr:heavy metal response regulator transcription factor [Phycisphaerae bacterium]